MEVRGHLEKYNGGATVNVDEITWAKLMRMLGIRDRGLRMMMHKVTVSCER